MDAIKFGVIVNDGKAQPHGLTDFPLALPVGYLAVARVGE